MNNDEARAAYIMAQSACAMARIAGMQAENANMQACGRGILYDEHAFSAVENEFCISHNAVVEFLRAGR